jgi:hypothetical protein
LIIEATALVVDWRRFFWRRVILLCRPTCWWRKSDLKFELREFLDHEKRHRTIFASEFSSSCMRVSTASSVGPYGGVIATSTRERQTR